MASECSSIQTGVQAKITIQKIMTLFPEVLNFHWCCALLHPSLALAIHLYFLLFTTSENLSVWNKMPETNID